MSDERDQQDLQDLVMAWTGQPVDDARREQLLRRLSTDPGFRKAFVEEARMLGMLRAVQSPEPRWLALEDELGWSSSPAHTATAAQDDQRFEDGVMDRVSASIRGRRIRWFGVAAAMAAVLLIGLALGLVLSGNRGNSGGPVAGERAQLAVVTLLEGVRWDRNEVQPPQEGATIASRRLRLGAGHMTLDLFNGVTLKVEGPADIELLSIDRVVCHQGKISARVPEDAPGFAVTGPGVAVVELGTEYALEVLGNGRSKVMAFKGNPEVSVLGEQGDTLRSQRVAESKAVTVDSGAKRIEVAMASDTEFALLRPVPTPTPLDLSGDYGASVLASKPIGYWRFEGIQDGGIPNEIAGGPSLRLQGPVELDQSPGGNRSVLFPSANSDQCVLMDGTWNAPLGRAFAVELWFQSENIDASTLLALIGEPAPGAKDKDPHALLLELTGRVRELMHRPGVVRNLLRIPPGPNGGVNLFSKSVHVPKRWHHLVAQRVGDRMEVFLNGEKTAQASLSSAESTASPVPVKLILGRLKITPQSDVGNVRAFVGRLDEVALYERSLDAEEIKSHYEAGRGMMQPRR